MSVADHRFTMASAMADLDRSGWDIVHVENSWILTKARKVITPGHQYFVFHVHPKKTSNYGMLNCVKPWKSCKHEIPDSVWFLFNLMRND